MSETDGPPRPPVDQVEEVPGNECGPTGEVGLPDGGWKCVPAACGREAECPLGPFVDTDPVPVEERKRMRSWDAHVRDWEYPTEVPSEEVDAGVTAVMEALRSVPDAPRGLPGEVLTGRAFVGLVLADQARRQPAPSDVDVRRVLNDPGAVLPRYRGYGVHGDEYESLAQWQVRALRAAGLLREGPRG